MKSNGDFNFKNHLEIKLAGFFLFLCGFLINLQSAYWLKGLNRDGARITFNILQNNWFEFDLYPPRLIGYLTQGPLVLLINLTQGFSPQLGARLLFASIFSIQFLSMSFALYIAKDLGMILLVLTSWFFVIFPSGLFTLGIYSETAALFILAVSILSNETIQAFTKKRVITFSLLLIPVVFGHPSILLSVITLLAISFFKKSHISYRVVIILAIAVIIGRTLYYTSPHIYLDFYEGVLETVKQFRNLRFLDQAKLVVAITLLVLTPFIPKLLAKIISFLYLLWILWGFYTFSEDIHVIQQASYYLKNLCFLVLPCLLVFFSIKKANSAIYTLKFPILILTTAVCVNFYVENLSINNQVKRVYRAIKNLSDGNDKCNKINFPKKLNSDFYLGSFSFAHIFIKNDRTINSLKYDAQYWPDNFNPCDKVTSEVMPFYYDYPIKQAAMFYKYGNGRTKKTFFLFKE